MEEKKIRVAAELLQGPNGNHPTPVPVLPVKLGNMIKRRRQSAPREGCGGDRADRQRSAVVLENILREMHPHDSRDCNHVSN